MKGRNMSFKMSRVNMDNDDVGATDWGGKESECGENTCRFSSLIKLKRKLLGYG